LAVNYGYNKARFITPVKVGAKTRARGEITAVTQLEGAVPGDHDDHHRDWRVRKARRVGAVDRPLHRLTAVRTSAVPL
jgi:acyl dehydratase